MHVPTDYRAAVLAALTISLLASSATEGRSQSASPRVTESVWVDPAIATLILVDELPAPASASSAAVVVRRPGEPPNNIILVTPSTSPRDLAQAVTALAFSRRRQGDQVTREMRTAVAAQPSKRGPATRDDRRADADLRRLRAAPEFSVPGIARGPALVIRMADSAVTRPAPETTKAPKPPRS